MSASDLTVMIIAGVVPLALLPKERKALYKRKGEDSREADARKEQ